MDLKTQIVVYSALSLFFLVEGLIQPPELQIAGICYLILGGIALLQCSQAFREYTKTKDGKRKRIKPPIQ